MAFKLANISGKAALVKGEHYYDLKVISNDTFDEDTPIISGESGASTLAAIIGLKKILNQNRDIEFSFSKNTNILIINTEGDTDKKKYDRIIQS